MLKSMMRLQDDRKKDIVYSKNLNKRTGVGSKAQDSKAREMQEKAHTHVRAHINIHTRTHTPLEGEGSPLLPASVFSPLWQQ